MVLDITKLTQEEIADLSPEEMQEALLKGWEELKGARGVIWDLNKKIKDKPAWENNQGFDQEAFDKQYEEKRKQENFNNFLNDNNFDDDQRKKAEGYFAQGLWEDDIAKLTGVTSYASNQNNSNQMWVWNWNAWTWSLFAGKLPYGDYSKLDSAGKEAYKSFSREKFGGLAFDKSARD